jgi:hypothetical protein
LQSEVLAGQTLNAIKYFCVGTVIVSAEALGIKAMERMIDETNPMKRLMEIFFS